MPKTPNVHATLQEAVVSQVADMLIDAAEARQKASAGPGQMDAMLNVAATLESDAVKWEKRLDWWMFLQRNAGTKES